MKKSKKIMIEIDIDGKYCGRNCIWENKGRVECCDLFRDKLLDFEGNHYKSDRQNAVLRCEKCLKDFK